MNNSTVSIALKVVALLLLFPSAGFAQSAPPIIRSGELPTFEITEYRGGNAWFDPAYDGQGWSFSTLSTGPQSEVGIGVSYTYEQNGQPSWLLLQGQWTRENRVVPVLQGAPVAVLSGPVFDGRGGSCPTCPHINPSIAQRLYQNAEVSFRRPDIATVKLNGTVALSGENALRPAELVLGRPIPVLMAGTWRFTLRFPRLSGSYQELNYETHGCEVVISEIPSPTSLNRFDPDPASVPFWTPPSGPQVRWLRIGDGFDCSPHPRFDDRYVIAYDPSDTGNIRAISLVSVVPVPGAAGTVASYIVPRTSRFVEVYLQDADTMIMRRMVSNNPNSLTLVAELLLKRVP